MTNSHPEPRRPVHRAHRGGAGTVKTPEPTWETSYRADRRRHHHRCRCCNRILIDNDPVLMAKVGGGTYAIHLACAGKQHGTADWTWRDAMHYWGTEALQRAGWPIATAWEPERNPEGHRA